MTTTTLERHAAVQAFDREIYDQLEDELSVLWRRDRIADDPAGSARLLRHLLEQSGVEGIAPRSMLRRTGIRRRWNTIFAADRPQRLAADLGPLLDPPVLDVLAGDCRLSRALVDRGVWPLQAVERLWQYPEVDWSGVGVPVCEIDSPGWCHQVERTLLVCAVLHHEPDPVALLDELARSSPARRWVVVENCVDSRYGHAFHRFIDEFLCSCVPEHRTAVEWIDVLGRYGEVDGYRELPDVPGLPFPYQVFVVERP